MIIDQAIYPIQPAHLSDASNVERRATMGVSGEESEFVRRFLRSGTHEASPVCPVTFFKGPAGRFVILYRSESDDLARAFFVDEETLTEFDFHPFQLLETLLMHTPANPLRSITIQNARAPLDADHALAASLWTADVLGNLLDCLLTGTRLGILLDGDAASLVSTIYHLLPRSCRHELSFNGLTASFSAYPFRMCLAQDSQAAWKSLSQQTGSSLVSLDDEHSVSTHLRHPWSNVVTRMISHSGHQACFEYVRGFATPTTLADLHQVAQAAFSENGQMHCGTAPENEMQTIGNHYDLCFQQDVHQPFQLLRPGNSIDHDQHIAASKLDLSQPDVLEQLDKLDDAVFDAIAGMGGGYSRLEELWPQIKASLAPELVEESRDQYVRLIVDRCAQQLASKGRLDETAAQPAIQVLRLLFSHSPVH